MSSTSVPAPLLRIPSSAHPASTVLAFRLRQGPMLPLIYMYLCKTPLSSLFSASRLFFSEYIIALTHRNLVQWHILNHFQASSVDRDAERTSQDCAHLCSYTRLPKERWLSQAICIDCTHCTSCHVVNCERLFLASSLFRQHVDRK